MMNVTVSLTYCDSVRSRLLRKFPFGKFSTVTVTEHSAQVQNQSLPDFSRARMSASPTPKSSSKSFKVIKKVYGSSSDKVSKTVTSRKDSKQPHRVGRLTGGRCFRSFVGGPRGAAGGALKHVLWQEEAALFVAWVTVNQVKW